MTFSVCLEVTDQVWVSLLGFGGALDALRTGYIALRINLLRRPAKLLRRSAECPLGPAECLRCQDDF